MEKSLFEQMGGTYTQQGDYILPNLMLPVEEKRLLVYGDSDTCATSSSIVEYITQNYLQVAS